MKSYLSVGTTSFFCTHIYVIGGKQILCTKYTEYTWKLSILSYNLFFFFLFCLNLCLCHA